MIKPNSQKPRKLSLIKSQSQSNIKASNVLSDSLLDLYPKDIACPRCHSTKYCQNKIGNRGQKQVKCKDCKKFYTIQPLYDKNGNKINCAKCNSNNYKLNGFIKQQRKYKCLDCGNNYILEKEVAGLVTCRWCGGINYRKSGLSVKTNKQQYLCHDCNRQFTENACDKHGVRLESPKEFSFENDIWTAENLNYENSIHYSNKLNFSEVVPLWAKKYIKKYILFEVSRNLSFETLIQRLSELKLFGKFIEESFYCHRFEDIDRNLILDFLLHLKTSDYSFSRKHHTLSAIKRFFETGTLNGWFNVEPSLIRREDWGKTPKTLPRFIPEEVMSQLMMHIEHLPESIMRMVLVNIECGFRVGELVSLPFDCLKTNGKDGWSIQYKNHKMKKEAIKPISSELALVIKEQQYYIREKLESDFKYLFCGGKLGMSPFYPEAKLMSSRSFTKYLRGLAEQYQIKDCNGELWHFQSHQFRHTVGTRMINAGVPQHIVQRYLGHESPTMTQVYAHIHDQTLRKEIEKYHESRVVNFQGETVELEETILSSNDDLEWFKKNVQARALEHGYCARPKVLGDCDIPGFDGCYNCPHWRTNKNFIPILQDTLERTNKVLEKARNCGWELQVKKNEPIQHNLERVIASLEAESNE
ncbi:site-specific integrase [Crocosphaera chwakensis]|uniref:Tn554, transposase B n=1 Tax=Crocosphaera chwakensis CCY0110 TaxID=391612 RepID=A3IWY0_9CHRO|nr:site-specific integrase [Crocosphaera chwakensis]EAZ89031.1 Tn554, transposase B [Crocosphaera chwakensis CCY0110]